MKRKLLLLVFSISVLNLPQLNAGERAEKQSAEVETSSWVYVLADHTTSRYNLPEEEAKALKQSIQGEFLWFKDGKTAFVIRDHQLITKVHENNQEMGRLTVTFPP